MIESEIKKLGEIIAENTEATIKLAAILSSGAAGKSAGSGESKPAAKKAPAKKTPAKKTASKKKPTIEDMKKKAGEYLAKFDDKDELKEARTNIRAINDHFGIDSGSDIEESDIPEFIGYLDALLGGDTPDFMNEEDEDEDEGDEEEALI